MMKKENEIFFLLNSVTKDKRLKNSDVRIFNCLISYNGLRKIFPSQRTISMDIGIKSIPDISKSLNKIAKLNYIKITRRKNNSNIYELNYDFDKISSNYININDNKKSSYFYCCKFAYIKTFKLNDPDNKKCSFINKLLGSNKSDLLHNTLVFIHLLSVVKEKLDDIRNLNAYLTTSFKNTDYSQITNIINQKSNKILNYDKRKRNIIKSIGQNKNAEYSRRNIY